MAKTGVQILGLAKIGTLLAFAHKTVTDQRKKGMREAGLFMQNEVKSSIAGKRAEPTSVDTGRFLNSVDMEHDDTTAKIYSELDYSKYLEFGTSRIPARKHFNNSLDRNRKEIRKIISKNIKL